MLSSPPLTSFASWTPKWIDYQFCHTKILPLSPFTLDQLSEMSHNLCSKGGILSNADTLLIGYYYALLLMLHCQQGTLLLRNLNYSHIEHGVE